MHLFSTPCSNYVLCYVCMEVVLPLAKPLVFNNLAIASQMK